MTLLFSEVNNLNTALKGAISNAIRGQYNPLVTKREEKEQFASIISFTYNNTQEVTIYRTHETIIIS